VYTEHYFFPILSLATSSWCRTLHYSFLFSNITYSLFLVDDLESPKEMEEEIPVVICAAAGRMGATVAAISSIYSNTEADVLFYIVGLKNTIPHIRKWIENSKLKEIKFKTVEFNPMVLKGKIRQDASRPELLQPVTTFYLGKKFLAPGDIQELYDTKLAPGHAAAFSDDCDLPSTHEMVRSVGMQVRCRSVILIMNVLTHKCDMDLYLPQSMYVVTG
uniref:Glycosyltransferase 8 domain containing 2 n=1 Tax=Pavo cristatus TaxID=9049 RepID=A0A8C9F1V2_PAVCR